MLIVGAPLLLGGVPGWAVLSITAVSLLCLAAAIATSRVAASAAAPGIAIAICALAGWTAIQAVPLPCSVVRILAPQSAAAAERALAPLGEVKVTCTLTRAPGATHEEILKGVAVAAAFLSTWLFVAGGARRSVIWALASSTLVMSVLALGHAAFGIEDLFGFYKAREVGHTLLVAPLLNSNNLGGFAAFGVPIWIGLARRERRPRPRALCYAAIALTAATALLSLSRGAIAELAAVIGVMVILTRSRAPRVRSALGFFSVRQAQIMVAIAAGLGLGMYAAADLLLPELENHDLSKLDLAARSFRFAFDNFWVGVGRGAFSSAFVGVEGALSRFAYAENFVAQWMSEWGVPAALVLLIATAHAMGKALRNTSSLARAGVAVGLLALAAQNLVDLAFELLGVSVVSAAALACVVAERGSRDPVPVPPGKPTRWRMNALALATLIGGVALFAAMAPRLERESADAFEERLRGALYARDAGGFRDTLTTALHTHPSEPVFPILAAAEAISRDDAAAGRWVNRAMLLAPGWAAPHVQAFQWLSRRGRYAQALLELRMAAEVHPDSVRSIVCGFAPVDSASALTVAPRGPRRRYYFDMVGGCIPASSKAAAAFDRVWLHDFPDAEQPYRRQAWRLSHSGDLDGALALTDAMAQVASLVQPARVARAELLIDAQRWPEAAAAARKALQSADSAMRRTLFPMLGRALAQMNDEPGAMAAVWDLRRLAGTDVELLAATYALEGELRLILRQNGGAFRAFREAYRINPDTGYLQRVAEMADGFGDRAQALWAYMQLCERNPTDERRCARRDELLNAAQAEHR